MRKILYISMCIPYDKARHAGGKTFNYYINSFAEDKENQVTLIAKVLPEEKKFIKFINNKVRVELVETPTNKIIRLFSYIKSINSKVNPLYKYGNTLTKEIYDQIFKKLRDLHNEGYYPDVVILEWTPIVLFIDSVKKVFPNAKYIASEHDVTFLGDFRKYKFEKNRIVKVIRHLKYNQQKKNEINALNKCNLIMTHNFKDKQLLIENDIEASKIDCLVPFYEKFSLSKRRPNNRDILFYGAMNRKENILSVKWFIDKVIPRLSGLAIRFIVIGNNPPEELKRLSSNQIVITGYVEDPSVYFEHAMCMVAPLVLGAGIKVKVLEALSSGVPVLTNQIGIEGINARDKVEYFHCETPIEYEHIIKEIASGIINYKDVANNAKALIEKNFDLIRSFNNYSTRVYELISKEKIQNDSDSFS